MLPADLVQHALSLMANDLAITQKVPHQLNYMTKKNNMYLLSHAFEDVQTMFASETVAFHNLATWLY